MIAVDFIIFNALLDEYIAVLRMMETLSQNRGNQTFPPDNFIEIQIENPFNPSRPLIGILAYASDMGRLESVIICQEILQSYIPSLFVLTGLAGGFKQNGVELGDILIASSIIDYERQRIDNEGSKIRWRTHDINNKILDKINQSPDNWTELLGEKIIRVKTPKIHVGPVFSGDKIIASSQKTSDLLEHWPLAIGVEMEGSGIATLLERRNVFRRFCMIRGVSDLANENKRIDSANWSQFACDASAAYTFSTILSLAKKGFFDPSA
ncbi:MAG TPA: hypothetical protein VFS21_13895 [Roseiflexaceae bacterium]|nr:hypothetical protein [Roseiflexaceae bacterium]